MGPQTPSVERPRHDVSTPLLPLELDEELDELAGVGLHSVTVTWPVGHLAIVEGSQLGTSVSNDAHAAEEHTHVPTAGA